MIRFAVWGPVQWLGVLFLWMSVSGATPAAEPPPPFDAQSTADAPCGRGVPPPGHSAPEVWATPEGLALTVRQERDRLCYTVNGSAEAPTIRVRVGSDFSITLRNEITDPSAIDGVTGPGKLTVETVPVPRSPGFFPVIPGMKHAATGATNLHLHGFAVPPVAPQDDVVTICTDPAAGTRRCGRRD